MNDLFSSVFALPSSSQEEQDQEQDQQQLMSLDSNNDFTPIKKGNGDSLDRFASSFMMMHHKRQPSSNIMMLDLDAAVVASSSSSSSPETLAAADSSIHNRGNSLVSDLDRVLNILDTAEDIIGPTQAEPAPIVSSSQDPFMFEPTPLGPQGVQQVHSNYSNQNNMFSPSSFMMTETLLSMGDVLDVFISPPSQEREQQVQVQEPAPKRRRTSKNLLSPSAVLSSSVPSSSMMNATTRRTVSPSISTDSMASAATSATDEDRFRPYQSDQWKDRFDDLVVYKEKNGNCLVPHNFPENQQLAQWIKRQRYQFKLKSNGRHSTLTEERLTKLNELGFVWDSHKAAWLDKFEDLKKFHSTYQHCSVPSNYTDRSLAIWVKCQRRQWKLFQQGSRSTMNVERFRQLDVLGFDWNPRNL